MPRRASSGINPSILIIVAVLVAVGLFAGKVMLGRKTTGFSDVTKLDISSFLENANSMRGNEYAVDGTIDEKLRWTPSQGQVVSLKVDSDGRAELIGIEIPPEFNHLNVEREQRYSFKVRIRQGGIPVATAVERL